MKYRQLGRTGLKVSQLCLGSMTWGTQNTEQEGHEQLDYATSNGINFIDTAEMYPTNPTSAETIGRTEEIIGSWLEKSGRRKDLVLATKMTGGGSALVRNGASISAASIRQAAENSLRRLKTDHIDLYQLHWPPRANYHFRRVWSFDPTGFEREAVRSQMLEILQTVQELINEGKIGHFGLSNESCWGTNQYLQIAESGSLPRVASIQNEYSLLCRLFDLDLAELAHFEDVGLLAYSPLAAGMLTGKYQDGALPAGSRASITTGLNGRLCEPSLRAVADYMKMAAKHGLDPAQMALAFCLTRPFMGSVIIGATSMEQLKTNMASVNVEMSEDVLTDLAKVRRENPMPI